MKPNRQVSFRSILFKAWFSQRERAIDRFRRRPAETQERIFRQLLRRGRGTEFGWRYDLGHVRSVEQFQSMVETFDYETFKPYIEKMLAGERNVTAPGRVKLFARSSGTTSDRSKYIPVTEDVALVEPHARHAGRGDGIAANNPKTKVFDGKTLTLGGSCSREGRNLVGDLSAVLIHETTFWSGWFRAPRTATAIIPDFDRKVEAICRECTGENITAFAGVPSWNLAMMRRVLDYTGRENLLEVWPNLCMFAHGGVEFAPYRRSFEALIPSDRMQYMETYNASEGFFALADDPSRSDMLLMLDYGNFFEFRSGDTVVPLEGVECGKVYAMLITSNNGLWRYEIGDTVEFTSTNPYRIRFAGRTRQYINVFGEELIVDNADRALLAACNETGAVVGEIYRGAVLHVAARAGRPRMDPGVRARARQPRAFRRGARPRTAGREFGLRRQTPHDARAAAADGRRPRPFPRVDACPGQEQGAAAGQRPSCGRRDTGVRRGNEVTARFAAA